jgi:hypothetical protein
MYALRACLAISCLTSAGRLPSGSTCRSNRSQNALDARDAIERHAEDRAVNHVKVSDGSFDASAASRSATTSNAGIRKERVLHVDRDEPHRAAPRLRAPVMTDETALTDTAVDVGQ